MHGRGPAGGPQAGLLAPRLGCHDARRALSLLAAMHKGRTRYGKPVDLDWDETPYS